MDLGAYLFNVLTLPYLSYICAVGCINVYPFACDMQMRTSVKATRVECLSRVVTTQVSTDVSAGKDTEAHRAQNVSIYYMSKSLQMCLFRLPYYQN